MFWGPSAPLLGWSNRPTRHAKLSFAVWRLTVSTAIQNCPTIVNCLDWTTAVVEFKLRSGLERLLVYCTRPPFALDRSCEPDREHLIYSPPKPSPGGSGPQCLPPLELLDPSPH